MTLRRENENGLPKKRLHLSAHFVRLCIYANVPLRFCTSAQYKRLDESVEGEEKKSGQQRNSCTHNCSKKLEKKGRERAAQSFAWTDYRSHIQAFQTRQSGKVSCTTKEQDTDGVAVKGVQRVEDTGFLQQNQTLWIPRLLPTSNCYENRKRLYPGITNIGTMPL